MDSSTIGVMLLAKAGCVSATILLESCVRGASVLQCTCLAVPNTLSSPLGICGFVARMERCVQNFRVIKVRS